MPAEDFTPEHDYRRLEQRAADERLLPDEDDQALVILDRENQDFHQRVGPGVQALLAAAWEQPGRPQKGTVGGDLVRLEVTVDVVDVNGGRLADIYLVVRLPFEEGARTLADWPGGQVLERLVETLDLHGAAPDYAVRQLPDGASGWRPLSPGDEMAVRLPSVSAE